MVKSITGYHGTKDLDGIIKSGGLLPRYYLQNGKKYWEKKKREYDIMTRSFAECFRGEMMDLKFQSYIEKKLLYDGSGRLIDIFPKLFERDEFLANCFAERKFRSQESDRYNKLSLGLSVYLAYNLKYAAPYEGISCKDGTPAVLELEFPIELLIPSPYAVMEIMGKLDLKYVKGVYACQENLDCVKSLMFDQGLGSIRVSEIGIILNS